LPISSLRKSERFVYEYDMGDCWQHDIRLEQVLPRDPRKRYPVCTDGDGDCPPEDCGGPWGYRELMAERDSGLSLLQALDDQALVAQRLLDWYDGGPRPTYNDAEFIDALERMRDWLADAPIPFNRRAVNATLRTQRKDRAMHFRIHLVTVTDDGTEYRLDIADLIRTEATLETTGLTLAESKQVLPDLQRTIVDHQVAAYLDAQRACPHCGKHRQIKEHGTAPFRTLFSVVSVPNPR